MRTYIQAYVYNQSIIYIHKYIHTYIHEYIHKCVNVVFVYYYSQSQKNKKKLLADNDKHFFVKLSRLIHIL